MQIKIKYFDKELQEKYPLKHVGGNKKSCWVDVRVCKVEKNDQVAEWKYLHENMPEAIPYKAGDYLRVYLGVAMELPAEYEAYIAPRGSTFNNYGLIQTNSVGVVDEAFCGDTDQWFIPFYALRDGVICRYDRVAQFRIQRKMPEVEFIAVDRLGNKDRGGHGSTGKR